MRGLGVSLGRGWCSAVDFLTCNNTKMQQDQGVVYGVENLRLVLQVTYQAPWGLPESPRRVVIKGADQPGKEAVFTCARSQRQRRPSTRARVLKSLCKTRIVEDLDRIWSCDLH